MQAPYVNVETNAGWTGLITLEDYGALGESASYYVQAGADYDGGDTDTVPSGTDLAVTDALGAYGEVSFIDDDIDRGYAAKLGESASYYVQAKDS